MREKPQLDKNRSETLLGVLGALYGSYDLLVAQDRALACKSGCSLCCTDLVPVTTLEAVYLLEVLPESGSWWGVGEKKGPSTSFNTLARMCMEHKEPPEDNVCDTPAGKCPLLKDNLCTVYARRPLACRTMGSRRQCSSEGCALQEPWWVTLDTAFFQLVEHLDRGGGFGLLSEVVDYLRGGEGSKLHQCEPLPGFPVPPEHQPRLQSMINQVLARPFEGRPLGWWLQQTP